MQIGVRIRPDHCHPEVVAVEVTIGVAVGAMQKGALASRIALNFAWFIW